jgi:hypothetical protein
MIQNGMEEKVIILEMQNTNTKLLFDLVAYKDKFNKTALNYATANNMKNVAIKILEIEKEIKKVNKIMDKMMNHESIIDNFNTEDYGTWKRIKVIPWKSKFESNEVN